MYIDDADVNGVDMQTWIRTWDDSDSTSVHKAVIHIHSADSSDNTY